METLQRTGHLDPRALLRLPLEWQILHLAHTRSLFGGRYAPSSQKRTTSGDKPQQRNLKLEMAAIAEVRQGPRPEDVASARELLARTGLPDHLRRAAQATLTRAGVLA